MDTAHDPGKSLPQVPGVPLPLPGGGVDRRQGDHVRKAAFGAVSPLHPAIADIDHNGWLHGWGSDWVGARFPRPFRNKGSLKGPVSPSRLAGEADTPTPPP